MTIDKYKYYVKKTKQDFSTLLSQTQKKLNSSKSKDQDYMILCNFWDKFSEKAIDKWEDSSTLFLDDKAMMPMPASVSKQFCNILFKIKNIDLLRDLDIYEGFEY